MKHLKTLLFLIGTLFIVSCEKEEDPVETVISIEAEDTPELFVSNTPVEEVSYNGNILSVQRRDSAYIFQGDILIPKESKEDIKAAIRTTGLWPDNTVPYAINPNLNSKFRVTDAIKHWEANTNIKFKERTTERDYIYFTSGSGCSSYIGKVGGQQNIILSNACSTGNTIHEIGHAVGFWHEQSRSDRDDYVTIHWDNIQSGMQHNFYTFNTYSMPSMNATETLDFGSIMMYHPYSFTSNGLPTITKRDGSTYGVQRDVLSKGDIAGINKIYPPVTAPETKTEYENGNYYTVAGVYVYRDWNRWWYFTWKSGWKEVKLSSEGYWYYA